MVMGLKNGIYERLEGVSRLRSPAGDDMDRRRLEGGDDGLFLLQQELIDGLACHVSDHVEAAVHADPVEEAERRDLPNRSGKSVPGACPGQREIRR